MHFLRALLQYPFLMEGTELLKVNVSFTFDRYLVGNYSNRKDALESQSK